MVKKFKIGTVQLKKDKSGVTVKVGNPESKNEKYRTSVEITVRDAAGEVLATAVDGYLVVQDPRKRVKENGEGLSEAELARIPEWVKSELFLMVSDGQ